MKKIINKLKTISLVTSLAASLFVASTAMAQETRDVSKYNIFVPGENLNGYDPVGYFPEGGGHPQIGKPEFSLMYMGVSYSFANAQNLDLFIQNPRKYEPTYGQWCARAMAVGSYVKINPLIYTIHGNRLHFFINKRAKDFFDADIDTLEVSADGHWKQISGEEPRY